MNAKKELLQNYIDPKKQALRNYCYKKALARGESAMPDDVADIMMTATRSGKWKDTLTNYLVRKAVFIDIYRSLGFEIPDEEAGEYI